MTARELIRELLAYPMDSVVYVGKGMGPVSSVHAEVRDRVYLVVKP